MKDKKKIIVIFILNILLAVSLVGCNTDSLGEYKKAAEKTEQIKRGQTSGEFTILMDFDTQNISEEDIKELNYYKNMKGGFNVVFDEALKKVIYRNYLNFGGIGFDFDMYMNVDEMFIKLPVVGKYINLNEIQKDNAVKQVENSKNIVSAETMREITKNWVGLMNKDDVFKGKDIVLTTPDGEVKTTEYTIKLNDTQIKKLFADIMNIVSKDENLKRSYENTQKNIKPLADKSYEQMLLVMKEKIKNYKVESSNYVAYVDIDGYIVNERIEFKLSVVNKDKDSLEGISYRLDIKNWDINKEQKFNFPILTDDNTLNVNDINKSNANIIEDMFKNID